MEQIISFNEAGRLPRPGDNCAIALRRLEAGTLIDRNGSRLKLDFTVLEGHRFAVEAIAAGEELLSWELPFGEAIEDIGPGSYVCNALMLEELRIRLSHLSLPNRPNFRDAIKPYHLDEKSFTPGRMLAPHQEERTFRGYVRPGSRGVGTRNYIVILATTSETSSYARLLENRLKEAGRHRAQGIDGIVSVTHTEGGGRERPNNLKFLLRVLSGFMVHSNVGAVLAVDRGFEWANNERLHEFMKEHGYPLAEIPHRFMSLGQGLEQELSKGETLVQGFLRELGAMEREEVPLSHLKLALQCGGSDAFSGISGNPLAGWLAKEIIRYGGSANLAETDELLGAEAYLLENVRNLEVAEKFLAALERFQERVAWHGHTAEENPSGGNRFRGLYNISLKSIGAARKRNPEVPLEEVLQYGQQLQLPGFHFMDSPGNDLESIAGQVASGCNLLLFVTGNGSVTNFPFVPTLKIVTTSARYRLLPQEMDINAGEFLDGKAMDRLASEGLELLIETASGKATQGEKAGHSQVSIWRDWRQSSPGKIAELSRVPEPEGEPMAVLPLNDGDRQHLTRLAPVEAIVSDGKAALDQLGLILPTSICAGQIARMAANRLNERNIGSSCLSRFYSLPHTEGCGVSGGDSEELYVRTMIGYLTHPSVRLALLLEHGCEKTHNDYFHHRLELRELDPEGFGWASIQLDGGIDKVLDKVERWFDETSQKLGSLTRQPADFRALSLGLLCSQLPPPPLAGALATVTRCIVQGGGSVIIPRKGGLSSSTIFQSQALQEPVSVPTLAYGQPIDRPGFHVMETPGEHWVETLTGMGATGAGMFLGYSQKMPMQGHPLIPLLQITLMEDTGEIYPDFDLVLRPEKEGWSRKILELLISTASGKYIPGLQKAGHSDFQLSRGLLGVSM